MNSLAAKQSNSSDTGSFFSAAGSRIAQESVQQGGCQITCPTARRTVPIPAVGAPEAELDRCYFSSAAANALGRCMEGRPA